MAFKFCPQCKSDKIKYDGVKVFHCPDCDWIFFQNVASATAAILEYQGKILMTIRAKDPAKGMYDLPGGFIDPCESIFEGVKREIKEELNIDIENLEVIDSYPNQYDYKGITYNTCDVIFYAKIDQLPTKLQKEEISDFVLIEKNNIDFKKVSFSSIKKALKSFVGGN